MTTIGARIKKAREESRLSQFQVGSALDVSDKTISGYELDRIVPPIDKLMKLSDLLKKPIGYFWDQMLKTIKSHQDLGQLKSCCGMSVKNCVRSSLWPKRITWIHNCLNND